MSGNFLFVHVNEWAPFHSPDTTPISMGYILSALKIHGFHGEILGDFKDRPLSPALFRERLRELQPLAVGFSTYAENIDRVRFWARLAKHLQPQVITILGGCQVTFMPHEALLQMKEVDLLCRGPGEVVMPELAWSLTCGEQLSDVPGLCFVSGGMVTETAKAVLPPDLDELPSPYLDNTLDARGKERAILFTSRGCNAHCSFCYTPRASNHTLLCHSTERVIAEMRYLNSQGVKDFWFADPNFASSAERIEELCRAIADNVPGIRFWCQGRYQQLDRNLIDLLRRAGAATIAFGLESSDQATLNAIKKHVRPDRLAGAVALCRAAGIEVELFTLYGLPGETFAGSLRTLDFVRSNGVEIEGNSISQQLHLFFGTPLADNPQRWGIRCLETTRPAYHSVCRDFATRQMCFEEIEKMSLQWRLHRTDFRDHVEKGENLFSVAGFITKNQDKLNDTPMADILLSRIYLQLDEQQAAAECLLRLGSHWRDHPEALREIEKAPVAYRGSRRLVVGKGSKIIYNCKGLADGRVIAGTEQYYQIAVVGSGKLLPQFEEHLVGVKSGSGVQFDVVFPEDYGHSALAGRKVPFQVYLHKVMEPVHFADAQEMVRKPVKNMYRFDDLVGLKKYNEALYYMVLRDSVLHSLTGNLNDMIALFDFYLKLGFVEKALDLGHSFHREPSLLGHIGRILQVNGYAADALDFLNGVQGTTAEVENQRIRAYMQLQRFDQAEKVAANPLLATNLETLNLKVKLAGKARLPLNEYLQRMDCMLDVQVKMAAARSENF